MTGSEASSTGVSFEPSPRVQELTDHLDEFIEAEIQPLETEYGHLLDGLPERVRLDDAGYVVDEYVEVRREVRRRAADAGFLTMGLPERVGGMGLKLTEVVQVLEHLYYRDPDGFHGMADGYALSPVSLELAADEYQRTEYFEPWTNGEIELPIAITEPNHGTDATWMQTTAERDGDEWVLDGTKSFVAGAVFADAIIVLARTSGETGDPTGLTAFVVDTDTPGFELGDVQQPMGSEYLGMMSTVRLDGCRVHDRDVVGDVGQGLFDVALAAITENRLRIPARAVGLSQWLFDETVEYASNRETFGTAIGERQFVKGMIADVRTDIETVQWLTLNAAWLYDQGEPSRWKTAAAKLRGAHLLSEAADVAIQVHGGTGCTRDRPFQEIYRNARTWRVYDGTDEVLKRNIADEFLGD